MLYFTELHHSTFMDILEAWPRPCSLSSPRTPSCVIRSLKFLSPFPGYHSPLGHVFRFNLYAGNHNSLSRSPVMSAKKGTSATTFEELCEVVWTVEADLAEGQLLYLSGESVALGCWEPEMAILMSPTERANIWRAEVKIAYGVNVKYNYFIKGEVQPLSDITWRPGPQFSLSVPIPKKQERKIVVRDSWMRSKSQICPLQAWDSWIEESNIPIKPSVFQAEDEDKIVKHHESDLNESKPIFNDVIVIDEMEPSDMVAISNAQGGSYSTTSKRDQPVEEPWFFHSPLFIFSYEDVTEVNNFKDEKTRLESSNQRDQIAEKILPEESSRVIFKDSVSTVILINSSICTMQRIAVLEDGKLVELLLEPVKSHVQCDSVYLGVVTKLVPHMGGAFLNIGSSRHSLMDIKKNREPFMFPPFRRMKKKRAKDLVSGDPGEPSAANETEPSSEDVFLEDAAEYDSEDEDLQFMHNNFDGNDVGEDFDVLGVIKESVNGSVVDSGEVGANFEDLSDGEHHIEEGNLLGASSLEISNSGSVSHPQDIEYADENKCHHVRKGTKIIVQVVKEGLGTKSPTLTAYPNLRSRFWILLTRCDRIGVSKKITGVERTRLKVIAKTLQPKGFGLTVRTVATGHSLEELQKDLEGLLSTWKNIVEHAKSAALAADEGVEGATPVLLHRAIGQTLSVVQDYFNDNVNKMIVDSPRTYHEVTNYLQGIAPDLCDRVELYDKRIPLFDAFNIEEEINSILSKRVPLPNGGSLVIEQTEALVSIDVNGGHGMFGHGASQEKATLDVNLAAAKQITKELRLRDIGGIIVVDFIDMEDDSNKRLVYEEVKKAVERDRSMVKVSELSKNGLMEITRKRVRPSVTFMISEPCTCCHGTGRVEALETSFSKIEQEIYRLLAVMKQRANPENPKSWPRFILRVDQHMCNYLTSGKRTRLAILSSSLKVWILLKVSRGFVRGAFELKPFTDEKADEKQHQVAISMLRTAEAGTSKSGKKLTLVPVKRAKVSRK
ncbi:Ribonuclease E/G-like protein [Hibiscus syriacus]|uniref:Ribonuclease E/G-like protein n=1 Tax=Hibiscus syriacus TaxID=106335 RepID=A0A6A2XY34_HIBSY|nr:ribonuclease E/G-like protein, chloroplastic [Hibiscus syriacus]KAE8675190.1 Ribonuclease E/G-like protein [Hibiscus syriacus]